MDFNQVFLSWPLHSWPVLPAPSSSSSSANRQPPRHPRRPDPLGHEFDQGGQGRPGGGQVGIGEREGVARHPGHLFQNLIALRRRVDARVLEYERKVCSRPGQMIRQYIQLYEIKVLLRTLQRRTKQVIKGVDPAMVEPRLLRFLDLHCLFRKMVHLNSLMDRFPEQATPL